MSARVAVLGVGPLGSAVYSLLAAGRVAGCLPAGTLRSSDAPASSSLPRLDAADILVEAAGTTAATDWAPAALSRGLDVVLCSCAALADPGFAARIAAAPGRVIIPAGAIGGLDLFAAAARAGTADMDVTLTTTKLPGALGAGASGLVFEGTAREAALAFPKTANVAVTLALATVGLDRVRVRVIAEAGIGRTQHRITVRSALGEYELVARNELAAGSGGRTSAVTSWSVVACLEAIAAGRPPGVVLTGT